MSKTFEFLQAVLPEEGHPVLAYWFIKDDGKTQWVNVPFDNIEDAARYALWLDRKGRDVYFACASYGDDPEAHYTNKAGKPRIRRKAEYTELFQTIWGDIDVKDKPGCHRSKKEALTALATFCVKTGLPMPTVVSSGKGLHIYWILEEAVSGPIWKRLAKAMKAALQAHEVLIDPSRATDAASVLRPVGTHWRKEEPAREVKLLRLQPEEERLSADGHLEKLSFWAEAALPERFADMELSDDLSAGVYQPSDVDADTVADKCQQVRAMRDSLGNIDEPHWYACLGVLNHATDGLEKAQAWSAGHPDYDPDVTERKLLQWAGKGPTLCVNMEEKNPGGCAGCPHSGKIKTPVQLGKTGATRAEDPKEEIPPWNRIHRYHWDETSNQMCAIRRGENGDETFTFNKSRFWVHNYIIQDGEVTLVIHALHERFGREGEIEEHTIKASIVGAGGRELRSKLASIMLSDTSGQKLLTQSYLEAYTDYLKRTVWEIQTHRQFGWQADGNFLLGDRLVTPTDERDIRLGGEATKKAGLFDVSKPPEIWTDVVERIYNRPGGEPYQFVVCAALGSALVPLLGLEEYSGIPIAVTSDDSGYGKTTVCWIALAVWGAVRRNLNVLSGDEASLISIEWQASIFNNIPHLLDEQTHREGPFTSQMLYMLSNGTARARGKQDGSLRDIAPGWKGLSFITGNKNILHKLTESRANPEAAQMRVFEISLDNYPKIDTLGQAQQLSHELNSARSGYGQIATTFLRYVMQNRAEIMVEMSKMPTRHFGGMHHDKERFYVNTAVCVLMAGKIMKELGFVNFDLDYLAEWSRQHILSLRASVDETRKTVEDVLSEFLTHAASGILVTKNFKAGGTEALLHSTPRDIKGRLAYVEGKLYVTVAAFSDWCADRGYQWHKLRQKLGIDGFLAESMRRIDGSWESSIRVNLGQNINGVATGYSRSIELDCKRLLGKLVDVQENNIITLRRP